MKEISSRRNLNQIFNVNPFPNTATVADGTDHMILLN
jgi:hypothetical protein